MNQTAERLPALYFLRTEWEVLKPITHVTFFQGCLWSALLRYAYNPWLRPGEYFHQTGVRLQPADVGIPTYETGERLCLGLIVPTAEAARLATVLAGLQGSADCHGQFEPGRTLHLRDVTCRVSGEPWPGHGARPLVPEDCAAAVTALMARTRHELWFHAPLRLTKPAAYRNGKHFADQTFLRESPISDDLLRRHLGLWDELTLDRSGIHGLWMTVHYGRRTQPKTLAGFSGLLPFSGRLDRESALNLLWASWLGIGKNRAFGLGCFELAERDRLVGLRRLTRYRTLLGDVTAVVGRRVAAAVPRSAAAGSARVIGFPRVLSRQGERSCAAGRARCSPVALVEEGTARVLARALSPLLSEAAFGHYPGIGANKAVRAFRAAWSAGYRHGLSARFARLPETISRSRLWTLLRALLPHEPLLDGLARWVPATGMGLAPEHVLTPLLCHLYLTFFDRFLLDHGFRLIRYEHHLLVLSRDRQQNGTLPALLMAVMGELGVSLDPASARIVQPDTACSFLGETALPRDAAPTAAERKAAAGSTRARKTAFGEPARSRACLGPAMPPPMPCGDSGRGPVLGGAVFKSAGRN